MREKILNLLGLMRRANALSLGEDKALDSLKAGKAKLLLFASDWMQLLSAQWPEDYAEAARAVHERFEKATRRKTQKGSKRVGTRRTNV